VCGSAFESLRSITATAFYRSVVLALEPVDSNLAGPCGWSIKSGMQPGYNEDTLRRDLSGPDGRYCKGDRLLFLRGYRQFEVSR
jgi:hypothetical protein